MGGRCEPIKMLFIKSKNPPVREKDMSEIKRKTNVCKRKETTPIYFGIDLDYLSMCVCVCVAMSVYVSLSAIIYILVAAK